MAEVDTDRLRRIGEALFRGDHLSTGDLNFYMKATDGMDMALRALDPSYRLVANDVMRLRGMVEGWLAERARRL